MAASQHEFSYATLEGVNFEYCKAPVEITDEGVIFVDVREDENGEFIEAPGTEKLYPADSVIVSISQGPRNRIVSTTKRIDTDRRGLLVTDEEGHTTRPGVFASGDVVLGAKTVVQAVAYSKRVAEAMHDSHAGDTRAGTGRGAGRRAAVVPVGPCGTQTEGLVKAFAFTDLLHTGICGGFISAGQQAAPQAEQLPPQLFPLRLLSMVLYNASPKASATSASSAQSRRSILKYLSVETEIHVSAEEQAANLVHQASAHPGHRTLEQRHARRAQPERISRLTAAMAATQGEYSSVNVKKLNAASGEKMAPQCRRPGWRPLVPVSTAMVLTTASFGGKAGDQGGGGAPVGKAQRREHGRNDPADARQHAGGAVRHHVEPRCRRSAKTR